MKKVIFALTALFTVATAQAGLINPTAASFSPPNPTNELAAFKAEFFPGDNDLLFLAKWDDSGAAFEEVISGLNAAAAFGVSDNGSAYDVSWTMTGLGFEVWGVVVKNGGNPSGFTHNLYEVDPSGNMRVVQAATEVLSANSTDISHISFIGKEFTPTTPGGNVPDVATGAAYAGIGLVLAVASVRRRRLV